MRHNRIIAVIAILTVSLLTVSAKSNLKILAHRGYCSLGGKFITDENTLDALKRAQEAHVDGVEFDVHMTADGRLIIRHDNRIDGDLSCQGSNFDEIRAYRLPFGNQIPTLEEWLDLAKQTPEIPMAIEIKAHATQKLENQVVAAVIEEVRKRDMTAQVKILSFKVATCDQSHRLAPEIPVVLNSSSLHHSLTPDEVAAHGFAGASYNIETILNHPDWIKRFKELGVETYFWMVDSKYVKKIGKKLGVDWVTTDFYDIIK